MRPRIADLQEKLAGILPPVLTRDELSDLLRLARAAKALSTSHGELVVNGWPVGSPEHCEWVKRDNDAFWNMRAALDAFDWSE